MRSLGYKPTSFYIDNHIKEKFLDIKRLVLVSLFAQERWNIEVFQIIARLRTFIRF